MRGCLIALAVAFISLPGGASAQSKSPAKYAIPAGSVSNVLAAFGASSGIQLVYDSTLTSGLRSRGVSGTRTADQALSDILAGTGLRWRFTSENAVTIENATTEEPPPEEGGTSSGVVDLDTITISGEKLERDMANVYSSVGVVTEQQIDDYVIPDLKDAINKVANARTFSANQGNSGIVLRGVSSNGLTQPINSSPAISVIVDGASMNIEGIRRGSRGTWDVASVEIFRGPQSTLQGQNSMAGAVIVNTEDPTWEYEGALQGEFFGSEYSGKIGDGAFMLSGPLLENQLAFRFAGQYSDGEKGIDYADPLNEDLDNDEFHQLRGKALITPQALPGFTALLTVSDTHDKPGVTSATGPDFFDRHFESSASAVEFRETDVTTYIGNLSQVVGEGMVLRSVSAYITTDANIQSPPGNDLFIRDELRAGEDFTQDIRLELAEDVRALSGVIGLNYGTFKSEPDSEIFLSIPDFGLFDLLYQDLVGRNKLTSAAAYADLRYEFNDSIALLFGGRLGQEWVENKAEGLVFNFDTFGYDIIDNDGKTDYLVALPKLGVAYQIDERQSVALSLSEGFRAGFSAVDFEGQVYDVKPEELWAYEAAYRSRWYDGRLEVNVNGFYYDFKDLQLDVDDPNPLSPQTITRNIGTAHAYGAELEVRGRPMEELTTFASLGFLKTNLDEAEMATGDFSGNDFPESPAMTLNLGGTYRVPSGIFFSSDLGYTASYYSVGNVANEEEEKVPGFVLVNAAVGIEQQYGSITLFVKNIFDEEYYTGIAVNDVPSANLGDGRMFGVRGKLTF